MKRYGPSSTDRRLTRLHEDRFELLQQIGKLKQDLHAAQKVAARVHILEGELSRALERNRELGFEAAGLRREILEYRHEEGDSHD